MRYIKSFQNDAAIQDAVDNKVLGKPYVAFNEQTGVIDFNSKEIDYSNMYLTFNISGNSNFKMTRTQQQYLRNIYYSINGDNWILAPKKKGINTFEVHDGDVIRFKGDLSESTVGAQYLFSGNTQTIAVYGNILSLAYGDNFSGRTECLLANYLFYESNIIDASNLVLPATTLASKCYEGMFRDCTGLTSAPSLPATTLASNCYDSMFNGCASLTTAPALPALVAPNRAYISMFYGALAINYIKCLATDIPADGFYNWTKNVSPTGTFVKAAGVNWPTGYSGIPSGWTVIEE